MILSESCTYEKIYFSLWEAAQRYGNFAQFRVIGKSHDDRMLPMLEIGTGQAAVFCLAGLEGTDRLMPVSLVQMALEYCHACECGWKLREFYDVRRLLEEIRLCFIPILNPDGYEIYEKGYTAIRNPVYRQMLRMQDMPPQEFRYNARGMDIAGNFPTSYCTRKRIHEEPASENETKALIRIFQEYDSRGLLSFHSFGKKIVYYRQPQAFAYNQKTYRLARHLQKCSRYHLEKSPYSEAGEKEEQYTGTGSPEQFYTEICKQPAIRIEAPFRLSEDAQKEELDKQEYDEIHTLPLEFLFSLS